MKWFTTVDNGPVLINVNYIMSVELYACLSDEATDVLLITLANGYEYKIYGNWEDFEEVTEDDLNEYKAEASFNESLQERFDNHIRKEW